MPLTVKFNWTDEAMVYSTGTVVQTLTTAGPSLNVETFESSTANDETFTGENG